MLTLTTIIQDNSPEIQQIRLVDRVKSFAKRDGLSDQEIKQKITWILKFSQFHNKHHPVDLNQADIESFLSSLATENNLSESTQLSALSAIEYLYHQVLQIPLGSMTFIKNKARRGFGEHFGASACESVIRQLQGNSQLMAELAVLGRLKLREVVNLRLADIDIRKNTIVVRKTSEETNFVLNIPVKLMLNIRIQVMRARQLLQIKTQARSNIESSNIAPIQLFSAAAQSEYLFPVSNKESPHISSQSMQLALLKNDINIAVRRYLSCSPVRLPKSFINPKKEHQHPFKHQSISFFSKKASRQSTFNFKLNKQTVNRTDRMHDLKQSVA